MLVVTKKNNFFLDCCYGFHDALQTTAFGGAAQQFINEKLLVKLSLHCEFAKRLQLKFARFSIRSVASIMQLTCFISKGSTKREIQRIRLFHQTLYGFESFSFGKISRKT